jgi:AraC-like DNA-binding protein
MAKSLAGATSIRNPDLQALVQESEWDVVVLAYNLGISLRQLERECKKLLGQTPKQCIREIRCALAVEMALAKHRTKEIAFALKFANPSQLCHQVKAVYSMSLKKLAARQAAK